MQGRCVASASMPPGCGAVQVGQGGGTRRRVHVAVMGAAARAPKPLRQRRNCVSLAVTRRRAPAFCPPLVPVSPPPAQASRMIDDQIGRAHVELQSLMRISYAVFCLNKKNIKQS